MSTPAIRKFASTSSMQKDGVFQLDAVEKELVHESFTVDTRDHEDHTFCGIMFKVECETDLPCRYLEIQSVHVRGDLGPMTVWVTPDTWEHKQEEGERVEEDLRVSKSGVPRKQKRSHMNSS